MPGANTTGQPDTRDYLLGRGRVYFASLLSSGYPAGFRDLGNAPEMRTTLNVENLTHKSSRSGTAFVDADVVISLEGSGNFTLDEFNHENLASIFFGTQNTPTNAAVAGFAEYMMIESVQLGRWYNIENSSHVRAMDIDAGDLTVEKDAGTDVTLVENTDYILDLVNGMIFFLSTAANVTDGDDINVTLAAKAEAADINEVDILTSTSVSGCLKFISVNAANDGFEEEYEFYKVKLKADGDVSLIGDDWSTMPFSFTIERNSQRGNKSGHIRSLVQS